MFHCCYLFIQFFHSVKLDSALSINAHGLDTLACEIWRGRLGSDLTAATDSGPCFKPWAHSALCELICARLCKAIRLRKYVVTAGSTFGYTP